MGDGDGDNEKDCDDGDDAMMTPYLPNVKANMKMVNINSKDTF